MTSQQALADLNSTLDHAGWEGNARFRTLPERNPQAFVRPGAEGLIHLSWNDPELVHRRARLLAAWGRGTEQPYDAPGRDIYIAPAPRVWRHLFHVLSGLLGRLRTTPDKRS